MTMPSGRSIGGRTLELFKKVLRNGRGLEMDARRERSNWVWPH